MSSTDLDYSSTILVVPNSRLDKYPQKKLNMSVTLINYLVEIHE